MAGQKSSGRTLFPFGTSEPPADHLQAVFSILRAAPFTLRGPVHNRIVSWTNPGLAVRLLGCDTAGLPATEEGLSALHPVMAQKRAAALSELTYDGARYAFDYEIGDKIFCEAGERLKGDQAIPTLVSAVLSDVTQDRQTREQIANELQYDRITGLLSDRFFDELSNNLSAQNNTAQLIRIRISNIEEILAEYGGQAKDYVLQSLTARLAGELSPNDPAGYGDSEGFRIILGGANAESVLAKSKKLNYIFGRLPVESPFGTIAPVCRISVETLRKTKAPEKTARSKTAPLPFRKRRTISETDILIALDQDRFSLDFQPVKTVLSREVEWYEALLRVRADDETRVSAYPYIAAAEANGLIDRLDRRALELASSQLKKSPNLKLSLNLSMGTILNTDARSEWLADIETLGDLAGNLIIELTETLAPGSADNINQFTAALRNLGCRIAIDDFGAGHAGFKSLMGIEAQILKLDGSFIRDVSVSEPKQNFVRMIAEMGQVLGLKTVAEMIDNEADAKTCESLGVDYLQGYWLGKPAPL